MFIVGMLQWWYGAGWKRTAQRVAVRLGGVYDYFSIDLLARSLFAPFRQISAGRVEGSLEVQWRAFVDRTISRAIGTVMRTVLILVGMVSITVMAVIGLVWVVVWAAVPLLPVLGCVLMVTGWIPWKI